MNPVEPLARADAPELVRRPARADLRSHVLDYAGYREVFPSLPARRELPVAFIPLIINLGADWHVRSPRGSAKLDSFVAGLSLSPTWVWASGVVHCLQVNLTPAGAMRFLRRPPDELTDRVVDIRDVMGPEVEWLRERLRDAPTWSARFAMLDAFISGRIDGAPTPAAEVAWAVACLHRNAGLCRIGDLAREAGWSRRHFSSRFRRDVGLAPKALARVLRFNRALMLAQRQPAPDWVGLAFEAGYADQPHMIRDFIDLSGLAPAELARRGIDGMGVVENGLSSHSFNTESGKGR